MILPISLPETSKKVLAVSFSQPIERLVINNAICTRFRLSRQNKRTAMTTEADALLHTRCLNHIPPKKIDVNVVIGAVSRILSMI